MNEEEKARYYLELMYESRPKKFAQKVDAKTRGLHIILHYLYRSAGEVCAGELSKQFHVSTARIAVALKNLSGKGFIETAPSLLDGRKVVVKITEAGRAEVEKNIEEMVEYMKFVMNGIGEDDLKEYIRICAKISALMDKTPK